MPRYNPWVEFIRGAKEDTHGTYSVCTHSTHSVGTHSTHTRLHSIVHEYKNKQANLVTLSIDYVQQLHERNQQLQKLVDELQFHIKNLERSLCVITCNNSAI